MKVTKSVLVNKNVNLEDLRKAFEDIVDCPMNLNEPNFLEENWIDTFENIYMIYLKKSYLLYKNILKNGLLRKKLTQNINSAILKSLSSLSKLKFGRWKMKM